MNPEPFLAATDVRVHLPGNSPESGSLARVLVLLSRDAVTELAKAGAQPSPQDSRVSARILEIAQCTINAPHPFACTCSPAMHASAKPSDFGAPNYVAADGSEAWIIKKDIAEETGFRF